MTISVGAVDAVGVLGWEIILGVQRVELRSDGGVLLEITEVRL